jgi:hypothetical protein
MGYVNKRTCWCDKCQLPTLHKQSEGLDDGELYAILHCSKCNNRKMNALEHEDDDGGEYE